MAPPRKSVLPKALPDGFILTDTGQKKWRLGKIIGQGGFGLIYLASQNVSRPVAADTDFVIKLEYQENGPLFSELKFYQRAAKPESVQKWIRSKTLDFLGIPTYWGSGLAEYNNLRYRFMAMDRLGTDLQKICDSNAGRLKKDTVLQLGRRLVDVLEYIHENEYVHADIKAANLMQGYRDPGKIYLADYGLSYRYCPDGEHKEYKENPKKGHNGTIEYTSLDAHNGTAPSRRGDLQILGFCLLHWLSGSLPWDGFLTNPAQVQEAKTRLMDNLPDSVLQLSVSRASTDEVAAFLLYVKSLQYQERPDYQHLKDLLASVDRGRLDFSMPAAPVPAAGSSTELDPGSRAKKAGRAKAASKARHLAPVMDEDVPEERRYKPTRQQEGVLPGVRRSLRSRPDFAHTSADVSEDEARPRPIPACYIRGPPISPRTQEPKNKQTTEYSKGIFWKGDNPTATSKTQEERVYARWIPHRPFECDGRSQTRWGCKECWDERLHSHGAYCNCLQCWDSNLWYEHRALTDAGQEAGPTQRDQLLRWWVFAGVSFVLGVWALGIF